MQQQSQIFVFSTGLANKGADAVRNGLYPTIIAYHCAQPETRKILSVRKLYMFYFEFKLNILFLFYFVEISIKNESI